VTRAADGGRARSLVAIAVVGILAATAALVWTAMPARASIPVGNELDGIATEFSDPTAMPAGVVNGPCTASAAHPYPVVLVHGTFANENFSWQALAPMLANEGYCVFGLNYGGTTATTEFGSHDYGIDYIEHSAAELAAFVQQVLAWTTEPSGLSATKVELVGHSQGGMMPRYYIEHGWNCAVKTPSPYGAQCQQDDTAAGQPGATDVHMLVGMAPSNHGADAYGLVPLFQQLFGAQTWMFPEAAGCGACGEQEANSPFLQALNGPGGSLEATSGVLYYVIESAFDEVVTPAPNPVDEALGEWPSAFLHGPSDQVANIRLQDQCPTDATEHIGIIYDPVALWDVDQALADNSSTVAALPPPTCPLFVPPLVSG